MLSRFLEETKSVPSRNFKFQIELNLANVSEGFSQFVFDASSLFGEFENSLTDWDKAELKGNISDHNVDLFSRLFDPKK